MTTPPENIRAFIELLANEEPKLKVASQVEPNRAVVIIVEYPSGALTVPLTPATARQVAATMVEYADGLERMGDARN
jgi:hypothetical protein